MNQWPVASMHIAAIAIADQCGVVLTIFLDILFAETNQTPFEFLDDCLAKWFASRQNQHEKEVWLQQRCTCPMCRSVFCILDVSYIEVTDE